MINNIFFLNGEFKEYIKTVPGDGLGENENGCKTTEIYLKGFPGKDAGLL